MKSSLSLFIAFGLFLIPFASVEGQTLFQLEKVSSGAEAEMAISPDLELLRQVPARLQIELPTTGLMTFNRNYLEQRPSGLYWEGTTATGEAMSLTLEQGLLFGSIATPEGAFTLSPKLGSNHMLKKAGPEPVGGDYCSTDHTALPLTLPSATSPELELSDSDPEKANPEIDVLITYTTAARRAHGVAGMAGWARRSIDLNNTAFRNSQMPARLRLVGIQEVGYPEGGSTTDAMRWLASSPQVRSQRNRLGADIVALLVLNSTASCGTAATIPSGNIPGFSEQMFQATRIACIEFHTFSHEMGHLIGMEHDPVNGRPQEYASFPWSYGHFVDGRFRTVMSYSSECTQGCNRQAYFSSPTLRFQGLPTGIAGARDNRRTGIAITPFIARFRQAVAGEPPDAPTGLTANAASPFRVELSWTDRSSDETQFEIERADAGNFVLLATVSAGTDSFDDSTASPQTAYRYRVRARNGFGLSAYTNTATTETPAPDLSGCESDDTVVCLLSGRFEVRVDWRDFEDNIGQGRVAGNTSDQSAIFWFFNSGNWELMIKIIDACSFNERFWIFSAATTNVEYTLEVRDTETGQIKVYTNQLGISAPAITDTSALATCG